MKKKEESEGLGEFVEAQAETLLDADYIKIIEEELCFLQVVKY